MRIGSAEEEEEEEEQDRIAEAECYRCDRLGHFIAKCYAKTHANGLDLKLSVKKPDSASFVKEPSSIRKRKADCNARTHASEYTRLPSKAKHETAAMANRREAEATAMAAAVAVAMAAAQEAARREAATAAAASKRKAVAVAMAAAREAARREAEATAVAEAVAVAMAAAQEAARREAATAAAASKRKAVAVAALCLRCGRSGHVIAQCYARTQASGSVLKSSTKEPSSAAKRETAAAVAAVAVAVAAAVAAVAAVAAAAAERPQEAVMESIMAS
jgi:hypothetical protein